MFFSSCYSTDKILRKETLTAQPIDKSVFNFSYSNKASTDTFAAFHLWTILRRCKPIKKDLICSSATDKIKLFFDGNKRMTVSLVNKDNNIVSEFDLKVKIYRNYLSIKRHLFVFPLPFIFYRHNEIKVILSNDTRGNLILKMGDNQLIWILIIAGGQDYTRTLLYKQQRD